MSEKIFYIGNFGETIENSDEKYLKEAEMFSTGVHRGVEYTDNDLKQLADTFSTEDNIPVQIDHSSSARDTVGYIRETALQGGKLMGKLEIIDKAIQEKINTGLMKKLSVSFYLKHSEEGFKPYKIREVSLVAFPQLKDSRLFSENGYSSDYQEEGGNSTMAIEKLKFGEEELTVQEFFDKAKTEAYTQAESDVQKQYSELEQKIEKLTGVEKKFNESQVEHKIEKFQEDKKVVPAQAEALGKLLSSFSEEQVTMFDEFMSNNKVVDFSEQGEFEEHSEEQGEDKRTKEQKEMDSFYEEHSKKYGVSL